MTHELVKSYYRKSISTRCMINIDLQKIYDSVEWDYLEQVMQELGFPHLYIAWVMKCVRTLNYIILVNVDPTEPFPTVKVFEAKRSYVSFLFAIVMEYLSRCFTYLDDLKQFKFKPRCAKLHIKHLCYSDDLLMFSRGYAPSIQAMMDCTNQFSIASEL